MINHRDCGAAKIVNGNKMFDKSNEKKIHKASFVEIKKKFKKKYPKLKIQLKLISLNKKIENNIIFFERFYHIILLLILCILIIWIIFLIHLIKLCKY